MVWQGVPEIICHGSASEIGLAHGTIARERIHINIRNYSNLYQETAGIGWPEARRRAEAYVEPLTREVPEIVEEMKAIAQGAGVDLLDIVTLNVRSEIVLTNYSDGCTTVGQAPKKDGDGPVFLAQNWDWVGETANGTVFFDIQRTGAPRIHMFGEAGLVGKFGFNSAGVGMCMNAIKAGFSDPKMLPVHVAVRKSLECTSFDEVVALLNKRGLASTVNFAIADGKGKLATAECSPLGNSFIWPDDEGTVCHSNHLYATDLPPRLKDHPSDNSFKRLARMQKLSRNTPPSFESIRKRMCDEDNAPGAICRSPPPNAKGVERMETLSTIIMDLKSLKAELTLGMPNLDPPIKVLTM